MNRINLRALEIAANSAHKEITTDELVARAKAFAALLAATEPSKDDAAPDGLQPPLVSEELRRIDL